MFATSVVLALQVAVWIGLGGNVGLRFGYYGDHNRARDLVRRSPNVEFISEQYHEDVRLEDSTIDVRFESVHYVLAFSWERYRRAGVTMDDMFDGFPGFLQEQAVPLGEGRHERWIEMVSAAEERLNR